MGSKNGLSGSKIGQPENNFGDIFEGDLALSDTGFFAGGFGII